MTIIRNIILAMLVFFWMGLANASELQFITHNIDGQTYKHESGELRGKKGGGRRAFNLELVREMMILLNYPVKFRKVPFKRGLLYVQNRDNYVFFNVTRNSDREMTAKWVGPLHSDKSYFYELKSTPSGIQTLDDAKKNNQICVLNGGVHEKILQKNGFENLTSNVSYTSCFQMLALKRVSLTITSISSLSDRLKNAGVAPQDIKQTPVLLTSSEGYLAFSKNISDEVIQQWQKTLDHLKHTGKYSQLVQEYLL
jgi:polar amino acid transport system substrate-binding protein